LQKHYKEKHLFLKITQRNSERTAFRIDTREIHHKMKKFCAIFQLYLKTRAAGCRPYQTAALRKPWAIGFVHGKRANNFDLRNSFYRNRNLVLSFADDAAYSSSYHPAAAAAPLRRRGIGARTRFLRIL